MSASSSKKTTPFYLVRTLGLYQPFATLMLHGKVETRWVRKGKKAPFPLGRYLIYSTKKYYKPSQELATLCGYVNYNRLMQIVQGKDETWPNGRAICIGDLVKIIDPICPPFNQNTFVNNEWETQTHRRVGLVFENVKRVKPYEFTGKQGVGFYKGPSGLIEPI